MVLLCPLCRERIFATDTRDHDTKNMGQEKQIENNDGKISRTDHFQNQWNKSKESQSHFQIDTKAS